MTIRLRIVQGRPAGKSMLFPRGEYVFGRGAECHVRPNSDWVSRQHCLLRVTAEGAFLRDLGSRNGTLVNGTRLTDERHLQEGDQLQVGPLVFEVLLGEPVPDAAAATLEAPSGRASPDKDTAAMRAVDTEELRALHLPAEPAQPESSAGSGAAPEVGSARPTVS
jgi:pSer/pThr/pTyr-binding forkhead associated (FHA) protein